MFIVILRMARSIHKFPSYKHFVTPQRMLWNWLWPFRISSVCPGTCRVCLVTQSDLMTLDAPGPHHRLALFLSSVGPVKFMSMEN